MVSLSESVPVINLETRKQKYYLLNLKGRIINMFNSQQARNIERSIEKADEKWKRKRERKRGRKTRNKHWPCF